MTAENPIRIGLCTDTHFWFGADKNIAGVAGSLQRQKHSALLQETLLDELNNSELKLVLHLGDVTCGGGGGFAMSPEAFYDTLAQTQNQFRQLFAQTYAIPGNHDCPPGGGDWSHFEQLWGLQSGQGCTIDLPMARLVLLNTHGHSPQQIEESKPSDPIYGWVNETELARLDDALKTAGVRPVLLFMHQCLHPPTNPFLWQDFFQLRQKSGTKNDHKG